MENMEMTRDFWKNKKVFITGYEGFLGSWLTKTLLELKADVIGLDILTYRDKTILTKQDLSRIKIIKGSVCDFSLISKILAENRVEFIFHLAAKSLVGYCLNYPLEAFSTNIQGTWNLLEASRCLSYIKGIIIASSDKAYGDNKSLPYKEIFPLAGTHTYDVSKSCADLIAYTYFSTYKLPVCVTRCGNIFGPGDYNFSRLIPDTIKSIINQKPLLIRSDGLFVRDYIFVKDIVEGYLTLARKMSQTKVLFGQAFNFSDENPKSVLQVARQIYKLMKQELNYRILNIAKYEIKKQYLSSKKAKKILSWKPKYNFDKGLKETIKWYSAYLKGEVHD